MLLRWREWRRARPFWGGLLTVLAGAEICVIPLAPLKVMLQQGIAGIPSVLMGLLMIVLGLSAWFAPHYRSLAGFVTVMIAVAALVMSNLGGFLIGTLLGVVGGSAIFAWKPVRAPRTAGPDDDPAPGPGPDPSADRGPEAGAPPGPIPDGPRTTLLTAPANAPESAPARTTPTEGKRQ
ncbi:DUF6114 domain-containing protein [Streptomyces sp. NPDC091272]|uniref:DUF6114 domain-containing protein n=1 Tax=Streptomyces sp. NPDC091272 TaxID=3365981 RepID=UPI0037F2BDA8